MPECPPRGASRHFLYPTNMNYFINIGSNLGDRRLNISRALQRIMGLYGWFDMSKAMESEPWGYESPNTFMNVGIRLVSTLPPEEMLHSLQTIEKELGDAPHRNADGSYADRTIDIDIVAVDELEIDLPGLTVPHPRLPEREFFLRPMAELAPIWKHPATGKTCSEMLEELDSQKTDESVCVL